MHADETHLHQAMALFGAIDTNADGVLTIRELTDAVLHCQVGRTNIRLECG